MSEEYNNGGSSLNRLDRIETMQATQRLALQSLTDEVKELKYDLFGDPTRPGDRGYFGRLDLKLDSYIQTEANKAEERHKARSLRAVWGSGMVAGVVSFFFWLITTLHK